MARLAARLGAGLGGGRPALTIEDGKLTATRLTRKLLAKTTGQNARLARSQANVFKPAESQPGAGPSVESGGRCPRPP
jgi:hypothetical protein